MFQDLSLLFKIPTGTRKSFFDIIIIIIIIIISLRY